MATSQTLEGIEVSGEEVAALFERWIVIMDGYEEREEDRLTDSTRFFKFYHPLCPILDPERSSDYYFTLSPVLGWTVIVITARRHPSNPELLLSLVTPYQKLLWATISSMPVRYLLVKALVLLCIWPLPLTREQNGVNHKSAEGLGLSEVDPTFMLSGIMMQVALQNGLHRASYVQDFIKQTRGMNQAEVEDRIISWAQCNVVAQRFVLSSLRKEYY